MIKSFAQRLFAAFTLEIFVASMVPLMAAPMPAAVTPMPAAVTPMPAAVTPAADPTGSAVTAAEGARPEGAVLASVTAESKAPKDAATVIRNGKASIEIPAGAMTEDAKIAIEAVSGAVGLDEGMTNVSSGGGLYRFSPDGLKFKKPVKITLPYDPLLVTNDEDVERIYTYFRNDASGKWEKVPRVSVNQGEATVTSYTTHFSDYVNSVLKMPDTPKPLSYNPNSIKEIKAADPMSGIATPEGLEGGQGGSAHFSFALKLPKGRGGTTPQLSLSYDSGGGDGLLGVGFDLSTSSIAVDTRFGLPAYGPGDTLTLDGQELVASSGTEYALKTEGRFLRITRTTGSFGEYFEVVDKGGVRSIYGNTADSRQTGYQNGVAKAEFAYKYALNEVRDGNGNWARYHYRFNQNCQYLDYIEYSGHGSELGAFRIDFDWDARGDRLVDAKSGIPVKQGLRLSRIRETAPDSQSIPEIDRGVAPAGANFRQYLFAYSTNVFGQSMLSRFSETDAGGTELYGYSFTYKQPIRGKDNQILAGKTVDGADLPVASKDLPAWGLPIGGTVSGTGSLTADAGVGYGRALTFGVGINGSAGISATTNSFMDINGDGLPDILSRGLLSGSVTAYLQNKDGTFSAASTVGGYAGMLGSSNQYSLGANVQATCAGSLAISSSKTVGTVSFSDIDGDGYVDIVDSGTPTQYYRNQGGTKGYVLTALTGMEQTTAAKPLTAEEAKLKKSFYRADPVRRWTAPQDGLVSIQMRLAQKHSDSDGVVAHVYLESGNSLTEIYTDYFRDQSTHDIPAIERRVAKGDKLHFRLSSFDTFDNDDTDWNVRIAYESIKYFGDYSLYGGVYPRIVSVDCVNSLSSADWTTLSKAGYVGVDGSDEDTNPDYYQFTGAFTGPVIDVWHAHGLALPKRVPVAKMRSILQGQSQDGQRTILTYYTRNTLNDYYALRSGFENNDFGTYQGLCGLLGTGYLSSGDSMLTFHAGNLAVEPDQSSTPGQAVMVPAAQAIATSIPSDASIGATTRFAILADTFEPGDGTRQDTELRYDASGTYSLWVNGIRSSVTPTATSNSVYWELPDGPATRRFMVMIPAADENCATWAPTTIPTPYYLDAYWAAFKAAIPGSSGNLVTRVDMGNALTDGEDAVASVLGRYTLTLPAQYLVKTDGGLDAFRAIAAATAPGKGIPGAAGASVTLDQIRGALSDPDGKIAEALTRYEPELTLDRSTTAKESAITSAFSGKLKSGLTLPTGIPGWDGAAVTKADIQAALANPSSTAFESVRIYYARYQLARNSGNEAEIQTAFTGKLATGLPVPGGIPGWNGEIVTEADIRAALADPGTSYPSLAAYYRAQTDTYRLNAANGTCAAIVNWFTANGNSGRDMPGYDSSAMPTASGIAVYLADPGQVQTLIEAYFDEKLPDRYLLNMANDEDRRAAAAAFISDGKAESFPKWYAAKGAAYAWSPASLDKDERAALALYLDASGFKRFEYVYKSIQFPLSAEFQTTSVAYPGAAYEPRSNASATNVAWPVKSGGDSSYIEIPSLSAEGRTTYARYYQHVFNTTSDFSPKDLEIAVDDIESAFNSTKYVQVNDANGDVKNVQQVINLLSDLNPNFDTRADDSYLGNVWNWGYAEWNGDEAPTTPAQLKQDGTADKARGYPLFITMSDLSLVASDPEKTASFDAYLRDNGEPRLAAVGGIYAIHTPSLGGGSNVGDKVDYYYTRIAGDSIRPSRIGGTSITKMASASTAGFQDFQKSETMSYTATVLGVSNTITVSKSTKDLTDVNGDGYPDLVTADSTGISVYPGVKGGFGAPFTMERSGQLQDNLLAGRSGAINTTMSDSGTSMLNSLDAISRSWELACGNTTEVSSSSKLKSSKPAMDLPALSFSKSESRTLFQDINGDGLPDFISKGLGTGNETAYAVDLNTGTNFTGLTFANASKAGNTEQMIPAMNYLFGGILTLATGASGDLFGVTNNINAGLSTNWTLNASVSIPLIDGTPFMLGGGFSVSVSGNQTKEALIDMNGDGLPDQVKKLVGSEQGEFQVRFNTGDSFTDPVNWQWPAWKGDFDLDQVITGAVQTAMPGAQVGNIDVSGDFTKAVSTIGDNFIDVSTIPDDISASREISIGLDLNMRFMFPFWIFPSVYVDAGGGLRASVGQTTLQTMDINGDGFVDQVYSDGFGKIQVRQNGLNGVNLLTKIEGPNGFSADLEYGETGNTQDCARRLHVLTKVTKHDGRALAGLTEGTSSVTYQYSNPRYDRTLRRMNGFETVTEIQADGTRSVSTYYNLATVNKDDASQHFKGLLRTQAMYDGEGATLSDTQNSYDLKAGNFPALTWTVETNHESGGTMAKTTSLDYDPYGNVKTAIEDDPAEDGDALTVTMTYDSAPGANPGLPTLMKASDENSKVLRMREGEYDPATGNLMVNRSYEGQTKASRSLATTFAYDAYGNVKTVTTPTGYATEYEYGDTTKANVTAISDSYSLRSEASYDLRFGSPRKEIDSAGNAMYRTYDGFGRITSVYSPYDEMDGTPALAFSYDLSTYPAKAVTKNKTRFDPTDHSTIDTVSFSDGFGRAIAVMKTGEVCLDATSGRTGVGMNVSGYVEYDSMGRVIAQYEPWFRGTVSSDWTAPTASEKRYRTSFAYDAKGRKTSTTLPDAAGSQITVSYSIADNRSVTETVDPEMNVNRTERDGSENIVAMSMWKGSFSHANGKSGQETRMTYEYDTLDQITSVRDAKGNLTSVDYDGFGRAVRMTTPDTGTMESVYGSTGLMERKIDANLRAIGKYISYEYDTYGRPTGTLYPDGSRTTTVYGTTGNASGRVLSQTDASGSVSYQYGKLGETTRELRTIKRLAGDVNDTERNYDMGYGYDYLGRAEWIRYPDGEVLTYGYDAGGQITKATGTNSMGHTFDYVREIAYDQYGQRVYAQNGNGTVSRYAYDPARRWLDSVSTKNASGATLQNAVYSFDTVGNVTAIRDENDKTTVTKTYTYDSLYQLRGATQSYQERGVGGIVSGLSQSFDYDQIGNMSHKTSVCTSSPDVERSIRLSYDFGYLYDSSRPHTVTQVGDTAYEHDANGNVTLKTAKTESVAASSKTPNARPGDLSAGTGFAGVAFGADRTPAVATDGATYEWDYENRMVKATSGGADTRFSYDASGERRSKSSASGETQYPEKYWQETIKGSNQDSVTTKHIFVGTTRVCTAIGFWQYDASPQEAYWYHADHIGSTSVVTDRQGQEYERLEYSPYGETWVEDTKDTLDTLSYMFSGKEMDSETGLYYYGARYLDPRSSMWMSADPAMAKYLPQAPIDDQAKEANGNLPGMGGVFNPVNLATYHYAGNNPVKYTDPDGRADKDIQKRTTTEVGKQNGLFSRIGEWLGQKHGGEIKAPGSRIGNDDNHIDQNILEAGAVVDIKDGRAEAYVGATEYEIKGTIGAATKNKLFGIELSGKYVKNSLKASGGVDDYSAGVGAEAIIQGVEGSLSITLFGISVKGTAKAGIGGSAQASIGKETEVSAGLGVFAGAGVKLDRIAPKKEDEE